MSYTANTQENTLFKTTLKVAAVLVIASVGLILWSASQQPTKIEGKTGYEMSPAVDTTARKAAFEESVKAGSAKAAEWPKTPEDLIRAFWKEILAGNLEAATLYSPGSTVKDFTPYKQFRPTSIPSIAAPLKKDEANGTTMYPITVDFPGMPGKQLGMAITTMPDGRLMIHGGHSIWW